MTDQSPTKSRSDTPSFPAQADTNGGQKSVTRTSAEFQSETQSMLDALAMLKDVTNTWPITLDDGKQAEPFVSPKGFLVIALPVGGHVIENVVTSDDKHDYSVDGERIIPVTSPVTAVVTSLVTSEEDANERDAVLV